MPRIRSSCRVVSEEADELVEVPLRIAGFLDAVALLVLHRGDVVTGGGGAGRGQNRRFGHADGDVSRWRGVGK